MEPDRPFEVFCLRDKRALTKDPTGGSIGQYVRVIVMPDGRIQVRAKGVALSGSFFEPGTTR